MNVLRVQAENLRCYEHLDWAIPGGASAILGDNGTGKTSRLHAIEVGLFADRGELGSPGVLRSGCDSCMVTVEVEHEGETYRVRRAFNKGRTTCDFATRGRGNYQDEPEWQPLTLASIAETDALIVQTLGMNRSIFRAVVFLGQGALALASKSLTPKQRMEMFVALVRLDIYPRLAKAAHDQLSTVNAELTVARSRHADALEQAAGKDEHARLSAEHDQAAREAQERLAAAETLRAALREQFTAARETTQAVESARSAVSAAESEHRRLQDVNEAAEEAREQLADADAQHTALTERAAPLPGLLAHEQELSAEVSDHRRALAEHQAGVDAWRAACAKRDSLLDRAATAAEDAVFLREQARREEEAGPGEARCSHCQQTLGAEHLAHSVTTHREKADGYGKQAAALAAEADAVEIPAAPEEPASEPPLAQLAQAQTLVQEARTAQHELAALTERRNTLLQKITQADDPAFLASYSGAKHALEDAREAHRAAQASAPDPAAVQQIQRDGLTAGAAVAEHQAALTRATVEKARAQERLAVATAAEERATTLAGGLAALTELAGDLEHAKTCLGTYAPSIVIENTVPRIEADFADNINALGGPTAGARVEFRTQKENKSGTVADRLDVMFVTADGHDRLYDDWSTGERLRLSLALARAIVPNLDLLIIDDPPGLDQEGKAAMVDTIHQLVHRGAVASVVVVSQEAELRDSFDQVLELGQQVAEETELVTA